MSETSSTRRNRRAAPLGFIFIVLCLIGVFTVFRWCINATKYLADNTAQKTKYEEMLLPIVMFDPANFTDPKTCDNEFLLQTSLWACMLGENREMYEFDEFDRLVIPTSDVDAKAVQLYGNGVKLKHVTLGDFENNYYLDENSSSYHVPIIAMSGFATPRVEKLVKNGNSLMVTVGYVPPTTVLSINYDSEGTKEELPSKFMLYELRKNNGEYYVYAVNTIDTGTALEMSEYPSVHHPNTDSLQPFPSEEKDPELLS